jgi:hypothetical protein
MDRRRARIPGLANRVESARRAWEAAPDGSKNDALLMGLALANAQSWLAKRADDIPEKDRDFIARSGKAAQRRRTPLQDFHSSCDAIPGRCPGLKLGRAVGACATCRFPRG